MTTAAGQYEPRVTVRCPSCRAVQYISARQIRRRAQENIAPLCLTCRKVGRAVCTDSDLWFWLKQYGVKRNGLSAREHVAAHGLPAGLRELLKDINPL